MPEGSLPKASLPTQRLSLLIRATGFLLGMLATAVVAIVLFISASFDDQQVSLDISDFMVSEYGRTLSTNGDIHIALWPWPSLQIGEASLSEAGKPDTFASWKKGSFELDALALLRHQLVIRHARIDGLALRLARDAKGTWNVADLFGPADPELSTGQPFSLQLEGLALTHGHVVVEDAGNGKKLQWHELELGADALRANRGGRVQIIAQLISQEASIEGKLTVSGRYRFGETLANGMLSAAQLRYVGDIGSLKTVDASLTLGAADWQAEGWTLADAISKGSGKLGTRTLDWSAMLPAANMHAGMQVKRASADLSLRDNDATTSTAELHLKLQDLNSADKSTSAGKLSGDWLLQAEGRSAQGKLDARLQHDAKLAEFRLEKIVGEMALVHPALKTGNARANLRGDARWSDAARDGKPNASGNLPRGELNLNASFGKDALRLSASIAANSSAASPVITARIDSTRFDADRLLAAGLPAMALPSGEALRGLAIDAVLHAENLRLGGMLMTSAQVPIRIADGKLSLADHAIALYGGTLKGSIGYDPSTETLSIFEALREVQLDGLAHDAKIELPLVGLSNATLDVRSQGPNWLDNANGVLRVFAKNARWVGVDLPRDMLSLHAGQATKDDKWSATPLTEIAAAFTVKGPELIASKLTAHSDAVSLTGTGNIQYAAGKMNLALTARPGNDKALAVLRSQRMSLRAQGAVMQPLLQRDAIPEPVRRRTQIATPAATP